MLLGNGFSIDYDHERFAYSSLAAEAKLATLSVDKDVLFDEFESSNFEVIVEKLRVAARAAKLYGQGHGPAGARLARRMRDDADVVRNGLADALAQRHPSRASHLSDDEIEHARAFLSKFANVFTLNYDLLLYWVVNHTDASDWRTPQRDGFQWPSTTDTTRHIWKLSQGQSQQIYFLHGALHLFRRRRRLEKLSYWNHGPLIPELRSLLAKGEYPLIVTEGTREEKEDTISTSRYLTFALSAFANLRGALFVHGVSMSANDDHIFSTISDKHSQISSLYVGIHGDQEKRYNQFLIERARDIRRRRREHGVPLRLRFYDSATAHVWR
ncbi:hypothetical protein ASE16_02020 [Leifsonia sp. Root227]|nr:hypothetical protein ASE16_02020 [Leifsonia sp. Root227]